MKTKHVFIDYENVQPKDLSLLQGDAFKVMVFIGANQQKISTDLVCAGQKLNNPVKYVRIEGSGQNALDFHIAYYLGRIASTVQNVELFIISKDTGFDLLVQHLKATAVPCRRLTSLDQIPQPKPKPAIEKTVTTSPSPPTNPKPPKAAVEKSAPDPVQKVLANFAKRGAAKPCTVKTLRSSVQQILGKEATNEAVSKVIAELQRRGAIQVTDLKVTYTIT